MKYLNYILGKIWFISKKIEVVHVSKDKESIGDNSSSISHWFNNGIKLTESSSISEKKNFLDSMHYEVSNSMIFQSNFLLSNSNKIKFKIFYMYRAN